jgi:hypothetical protein
LDGIPANDSSKKGVLGTKINVARRSAEVPKTDISADRQKIGRIDPVEYVSVTLKMSTPAIAWKPLRPVIGWEGEWIQEKKNEGDDRRSMAGVWRLPGE